MDVERFKDVLKSRGIKLSWISDKMGINRATLDAKIKENSSWNAEQMIQITDILRLSQEEFMEIFFGNRLGFYTKKECKR